MTTSPGRAPALARTLGPLLGLALVVGAAAVAIVTRDPDGAGNGGGELTVEAAPVALGGDLPAAGSCEELLDSYVTRGLEEVDPWGWGTSYPWGARLESSAPGGLRDLDQGESSSADAAGRTTTQRAESSETGTNVQEEGVDEADVVKTAGDLLVRVSGSRADTLTTYDVGGREARREAVLDLPLRDAELLLAGDTVVAVGRPLDAGDDERATAVALVDVADPAEPLVVEQARTSAEVRTVRQHGDVVRLVLSTGLPDLDFAAPHGHRDDAGAHETNEEVVRASEVSDWLPSWQSGDGEAAPLLECDEVAVPRADLALDTVAVVGIDLAADTPLADVEALGLAGATEIAYESPDHLYLAAGPGADLWPTTRGPGPTDCLDCADQPRTGADDGVTHVFDFALDGARAAYAAAGEVEGTLSDRWSVDERDGVLRLALGPSSATADAHSVVTLEQRSGRLEEVGRLDGLGAREDLKSVRWFDDLAVLVTFRRIDPLYAVDLADDAAPVLLGELKMPGFSAYLHPLGERRMIGVGEGPQSGRWGAQAALFGTVDLTRPRRLSTVGLGRGTMPRAGEDPRQFTWVQATRTAYTVVEGWRRGARVALLGVLRPRDGVLSEVVVPVEFGDDVDAVRVVPVGDEGRVVLVTGEDVEFFAPPVSTPPE